MKKSGISKIFESRTFLIIFSFVVSIVLWVYVEKVENVVVVSLDIPVAVEFLNGEVVSDRGFVITDVETTGLTFRFSGRRSTISSLYDTGAVRVTANLADITTPGRNMLNYRIIYDEGIDERGVTVTYRSEGYVTVNVERLFEKQVPVTVRWMGDIAAEGYTAEPTVVAPEVVSVYGPQSEVERVTAVRVTVERENLTKTLVADMPFVAIDADGEEIVDSGLSFDRDLVSVTIPIHMIKEVALVPIINYGAGAIADNTIVTVSPEVIVLSGDPELLGAINSITLNTIDLTQFESFYTGTASIVIPNGAINVSGETEATVTITIRGLETKRIIASAANIQLVNAPEDLTATLMTTSVEVILRGEESELAEITADNLRIVADLAEFAETSGVFTVPVRVYIDGAEGSSGPLGEYKVTVRIGKDGTAGAVTSFRYMN